MMVYIFRKILSILCSTESCDFVSETGQVTCYKIMTGNDVTWNDANATCVEQGGFLVEHRNNEEFEVLTSFMNETG